MRTLDVVDALAVLVVLSSTAVGLLVAGALRMRWRWQIQWAVIALPLVLTWSVNAHEPLVYFALESILVAFGLTLWTLLRRPKHLRSSDRAGWKRQLRLSSFLLFVLFGALGLAAAVRMPHHPVSVWLNLLGASGAAGLAVLAGLWAVHALTGWWWRIPIALLVSLVLSVPLVLRDNFLLFFPELEGYSRDVIALYAIRWLWVLPAITAVSGLAVLCYGVIAGKRNDSPEGVSVRRVSEAAAWSGLVVISAALILPCLAAAARLWRQPSIPAARIEQPNGYDDILAAGQLVVARTAVMDHPQFDAAALREALEENRPALERLRLGLSKPCERRLAYTDDDFEMWPMQQIRNLSRALAAEGRLAELEGRYDDAVVSYLNVVRLGHALDRGGLMIDWLVGRAIEATGVVHLHAIRDKLDGEKIEGLLETLRNLDREREPVEAVYERDKVWEELIYGWRESLESWLHGIVSGDGELERVGEWTIAAKYVAALRLLIIDLMVQDFRERNGRYPDRLDEAVPIDDRVARDPYARSPDTPFRYVKRDDGFLLYSVGPDGDDDDGVIRELTSPDGDVTFESLFPR